MKRGIIIFKNTPYNTATNEGKNKTSTSLRKVAPINPNSFESSVLTQSLL